MRHGPSALEQERLPDQGAGSGLFSRGTAPRGGGGDGAYAQHRSRRNPASFALKPGVYLRRGHPPLVTTARGRANRARVLTVLLRFHRRRAGAMRTVLEEDNDDIKR